MVKVFLYLVLTTHGGEQIIIDQAVEFKDLASCVQYVASPDAQREAQEALEVLQVQRGKLYCVEIKTGS